MHRIMPLGGLLLGLMASTATASIWDRICEQRAYEHTHAGSHQRAGCPHSVAPWRAQITYNDRYQAGPIGGGVLRPGRGPTVDEGTWGRDYVGGIFQRRVFLLWSGGSQYYGGTGAYETDGPKLIEH